MAAPCGALARGAAAVVGVAFVAALSTGCEGGGAGGEVVVRDSAGVQIVENPRATWRDGDGWTVEPLPVASIGVAEGDATRELHRVADAARVGDTIVVVNAGTFELRWYDAAGTLLRTVGREGGGPGEFGRVGPGAMCALPDGRLVVSDPMQMRAHVFASDGSTADIIRLELQAAFPTIADCFEDGTLLVWHAEQPAERIPGGIIPGEFIWSRVSAGGTHLSELARLPANPQYLLDQGDGTATYHTIPFTVRPSAAAGGNALYVASGAEPAIERRVAAGATDLVIRWTPASRVRSADVYDRYRSHVLDGMYPDRRREWSRFFALRIDVPEWIAAVHTLRVDEAGHVWAERYRLPWDSVAVWDVFKGDGRWLGGVTVPRGLTIYEIGEEYVLGVQRDELGVERVRMYRLRGR